MGETQDGTWYSAIQVGTKTLDEKELDSDSHLALAAIKNLQSLSTGAALLLKRFGSSISELGNEA